MSKIVTANKLVCLSMYDSVMSSVRNLDSSRVSQPVNRSLCHFKQRNQPIHHSVSQQVYCSVSISVSYVVKTKLLSHSDK
jgi:hypothetical protein